MQQLSLAPIRTEPMSLPPSLICNSLHRIVYCPILIKKKVMTPIWQLARQSKFYWKVFKFTPAPAGVLVFIHNSDSGSGSGKKRRLRREFYVALRLRDHLMKFLVSVGVRVERLRWELWSVIGVKNKSVLDLKFVFSVGKNRSWSAQQLF